MNDIVCSGGLGNQMFQYAFYYAQKRENASVEFDVSSYENQNIHNGFELERCFGINDYVCNQKTFSKFNKLLYIVGTHLNLGSIGNIKIERINHFILNAKWRNAILFGYWQNPVFFEKYRNDILHIFTFKNITPKNIELSEEMQKCNSVGVHIRRGDYLKSPRYYCLTETDYYQNCINYLNAKYMNLRYFVLSDDISWCKSSGLFPSNTVYVDWNQGLESYQDMFLLKHSKYCVMANSTFSWWGAYLGNHEEVLRPSVYKNDWDKKKLESFFDRDWTEIEVNVDK